MSDYFEKYPASSDSLRELARNASGSGSAFVDVRGKLDSGHRDALDEVSDDLNGAIGPTIEPYMANASQAAQAAIWAACQLEIFADAVDAYNETSSDPRSIEKLNAAFDDLASNEIRHAAGPLNREKARLEAELDDAASSVSSALENGPTEADLKREWQAGNLSVAAIVAWPGLGLSLTDLPVDLKNSAITEAGLGHLSDEKLANALGDAQLNLEVREAILESRKDAVEKFQEDWKPTVQPGLGRDSTDSNAENVSGLIVGPDGHVYPVGIPQDRPASDTPVLEAQGDVIPDDGTGSGWTTVNRSQGEVAFGEEIDLSAQTTFAILGASARHGLTNPSGEWQSIGKDQGEYLVFKGEATYVADGTETPADPKRPQLGPYPEEMRPGDDEYRNRPDSYRHMSEEEYRRSANAYRPSDAATLAIGTLEGLSNAQQAEFNRHWITEVVLQENESGERRAVINMYQVQTNGEDLRVGHLYGTVDPETGELTSYSDPGEK